MVDSATRIVGGYDIGEATIAPFDGGGEPLTINIKNEYLVASLGGRVIASVPDLITIVDYETSTPINAERLRFGQRVTVFGVGCPRFYRTPRALDFVAPGCFGFPFDYRPIEEIAPGSQPAKGSCADFVNAPTRTRTSPTLAVVPVGGVTISSLIA